MELTEQELANELRAMRPLPEPAFAGELDRRAAAGFPKDESRRFALPPMRRLVPAIGALATLVVVGAVAVSQIETSEDGGPTGVGGESLSVEPAPDPGATKEAAPQGGAAGAAADSAIAPAPAPSPDLAPGAAKREVERNASLTLSTDPDGVAGVADGVIEVTDRYHGFVVSSNVHTADDEASRASFDLRVPTARLSEALADLSGLAHVQSRNEGSIDITAPVATARERVADDRAELEGLLDQLAGAGTPEESAAVRARIRIVRADLEAARAELQSLSQRADLTAINVTVVGRGDGGGGGGWTLGDAADDAVSVLRTSAGIALVSAAILLPLALLGGGLLLGGRTALRRSRERALDARD